jgi:hypothetical protein
MSRLVDGRLLQQIIRRMSQRATRKLLQQALSKTFAMVQLNRRVDKGKDREITEDASDCESSVRQYLKTARREPRKVKAKLFTQRALARGSGTQMPIRTDRCVVHTCTPFHPQKFDMNIVGSPRFPFVLLEDHFVPSADVSTAKRRYNKLGTFRNICIGGETLYDARMELCL